MEAGADTRLITPSLEGGPVYLAGFQGNRVATGVADDLRVRTMALREEGRPFALAVCDLIGLVREDTLAVRASLPGVDVVVASTHTHSGPDTIGLWGPDERTRGVDEPYLERVRERVVASIESAVASLEPAWLRFGAAPVDGVVRNFRDPEVLDDVVSVLVAEGEDGSAIGTLLNFPCHPEVLDGESTVVSADMAGAACRAVERGRGGIAVWASGGLGGMQSPDTGVRTPEEAGRLGSLVASAALGALGAERFRPELRYRRAEVDLSLWNPRFRAALDAGLLRGTVGGGQLRTEVSLLELGPARVAFAPGEVLPALGLVIKEGLACRFPFLVGLANDELGYILPREQFVEPADWDDPGPQYEESMSVGPETGPRLMDALDRLLADLAQSSPLWLA